MGTRCKEPMCQSDDYFDDDDALSAPETVYTIAENYKASDIHTFVAQVAIRLIEMSKSPNAANMLLCAVKNHFSPVAL